MSLKLELDRVLHSVMDRTDLQFVHIEGAYVDYDMMAWVSWLHAKGISSRSLIS